MNNRIFRITDAVHGTICMSEIERDIMTTPLFNRLHYVSQTSTVYLTYPSNNSKRFDHSLGTMKLCGDIFFYSIVNADKNTVTRFLDDFKEQVQKIIKRWDTKMPDKYKSVYGDEELAKGIIDIGICNFINGLYQQYIPNNVDREYWNYFVLAFQSIRNCGLLHDIGHPPFSHMVENGLDMAYEKVSDNSSLKRALKVAKGRNTQLHEEIGNIIFDEICHSALKEVEGRELEERFFYILVLEIAHNILTEKTNLFKDIHRIIDGALDGDRLDNINRDALMTGLDKGFFDYTRLVNSMILIGDSKSGYAFCPDIKTLFAVEECFSKRWKNYRTMTHHHRVIKTNYMLTMIIYYLARDYCEIEGNRNKKTEESNSIFLPYDISGLWEPINETSSNKKRIIRFIQWNDNWLMTVLQKAYLDLFLQPEEKHKTQLYYFLEEIVENRKNYNSLVKGYEDYKIIDNVISNELEDYINELKAITIQDNKTNISETQFLADIAKIELNGGSFFTTEIFRVVSCFSPKKTLLDVIGVDVQKDILNKFQNEIDDVFLVDKKLKTGTDNLLSLYDQRSKEKRRFIDVSHIDETLKLEGAYIPDFYVYIKWKKESRRDEELYTRLKKEIGKIMAIHTKKYIQNKLSKYLQEE